jgi:RHS repeat-associated protein
MDWQNGRELAKIEKPNGTDTETYSFEYNLSGLRTKKTKKHNDTVVDVINYYYDDSNNLIGLKKGTTTVLFYYDSDGKVYSMTKGDDTYFFIKNLQGDVTKIIDENGNTCATYAYDAWGALLAENEDSSVEGLNPFRYRGYVYDTETELYYLQSRYYDPKTGRFINADDPAYNDTVSGSPLSTNMFAYCENNAVNCIDKYGFDAVWLHDFDGAPWGLWTFGHTSLLLQDKMGNWWYFYWGDKSVQLICVSKYKKIGKKWTLSSVNNYLKKYNYYKGKYDVYLNIKGDFTKSLTYLNNMILNLIGQKSKSIKSNIINWTNKTIPNSNPKYSLFINNCVQVCIDALVKGSFYSYDNSYKQMFKYARNNYCIPNSIYNGVFKFFSISNSHYGINYALKYYKYYFSFF